MCLLLQNTTCMLCHIKPRDMSGSLCHSLMKHPQDGSLQHSTAMAIGRLRCVPVCHIDWCTQEPVLTPPSLCWLPEPLVLRPYRQLPSFILYIHALPTMRLCPLTMLVGASHSRSRTNRSLEQLPKVRVVRLAIKTQRATVLEVCHKLHREAFAQELNRYRQFFL